MAHFMGRGPLGAVGGNDTCGSVGHVATAPHDATGKTINVVDSNVGGESCVAKLLYFAIFPPGNVPSALPIDRSEASRFLLREHQRHARYLDDMDTVLGINISHLGNVQGDWYVGSANAYETYS